MAELAAMVKLGKLTPRVTATYPLDQYAEAFAAIAQRRARGKVVLAFD